MAARSSGFVVVAAAGLVLSIRSAPAQAPWVAESPQAVLDRFASTFDSRDVDAVAALFTPDATFFGSSFQGLAEPLRGPDGARAYFARVFAPVVGGWGRRAGRRRCASPPSAWRWRPRSAGWT